MTETETKTDSRTYSVRGMTCGHCAAAVAQEVKAIPGVARADVDLVSGRLEITGAGVTDEAVRAAVAEAGYAVSDR